MRILDFSSGNTCKNNVDIIKKMIDALAEVDTERKFTIKWQLFQKAPPNIPLTQQNFHFAYHYAMQLGYKTTASVFDQESLNFLLQFNPCFVKIANRPDLYWLHGEVPRRIPVYMSAEGFGKIPGDGQYCSHDQTFHCVKKYPAQVKDYDDYGIYSRWVSDHTIGWDLLNHRIEMEWPLSTPEVWEKHIVLERDPDNPDAGPFAITPPDLKEIM